ncbi:maleylpyruvate isomerase N-terminal domain-containing protein [Glutamicibacter soli]|uniref:maleylpyruvate isomerase N-terminal domain-containing protein n=1 Tax=Glutamicibacter soli TaxID=453836 RepID=UPI003C7516AA
MDDAARWRLIDEERQRLDSVLAALQPGQWELPTLCEDWDVRHVVAHLSAAGSTATPGAAGEHGALGVQHRPAQHAAAGRPAGAGLLRNLGALSPGSHPPHRPVGLQPGFARRGAGARAGHCPAQQPGFGAIGPGGAGGRRVFRSQGFRGEQQGPGQGAGPGCAGQ